MSVHDRAALNKEMQLFITAMAAEIQDLNRHVENVDHLPRQIAFHKKIVSSLFLRKFKMFNQVKELLVNQKLLIKQKNF